MVADLRTRQLISGRWEDGEATSPVRDPATGEVIAEVVVSGTASCAAAVDAADEAAAAWAATPPRERSEILRRAFELMLAERDQLAALITRENGKVLADAQAELTYAAEFFRWFAEEAVRISGDFRSAPAGDKRILVTHQPVGVSLLITPWNFPAAMATRKLAPALAAGCTTILKPAPETPLTALAIADVLQRAGVPDGVVNVVNPHDVGPLVSQMLHDPRVRNLSFTGSTEVGRILLEEAADQVVRCSMELGGNAPFLVLSDADVEAAVSGAMVAKMRNGGAACTAANRFYVASEVADEFITRFGATMDGIRLGPGLDPASQLGSMVSLPERDKVDGLVKGAVGAGAQVVAGGRAPEGIGAFYPATVLADVPATAGILATEVFGPVAPVVIVSSDEEAVRYANATEFGLISYVYTRDMRRGLRIAEELQSGMVALNRGVVSDPAAPFGGIKQSGIGREGGFDGIHEFLESKYVAFEL